MFKQTSLWQRFSCTAALMLVMMLPLKASFAQSTESANRAYPPSCLANGLPLGQSALDPQAITVPFTYYDYSVLLGSYLSEAGSVSIWRVPCSGGVAATVLEFDRLNGNDGNENQYPEFPDVYITPASNSSAVIYPRLAREPNTLYERTTSSAFFFSSSIYVLEYYDPNDLTDPIDAATTANINYNQAFTLQLNNLAGGSNLVINVPAYAPASSSLVPISGYMSTNWTNPNESGEGMVLQVYDNGDGKTRTLSFAWFTYDDAGVPFWLYGQASFNIGATSATATTVYFNGGSFAGTLASGVPDTNWGTVTFTFPDCSHMNIAYSGDASAVQGPKGSGSATFRRVADVVGLACQ